jgi:hypothetical protein
MKVYIWKDRTKTYHTGTGNALLSGVVKVRSDCEEVALTDTRAVDGVLERPDGWHIAEEAPPKRKQCAKCKKAGE